MRSNNNSRTPATDFVQDYAAKRQAQMDRARQLREERLQQQQQQPQQAPNGGGAESNASSPAPTLNSPTGTPGSASSRPPPHVPRSRHSSSGHVSASPNTADPSMDNRVLYVKETDFKQATQAGIITPDQARQLWAMLSNQIIRVCPPSGQSNNAVSVSSLMALSNNSTASSHADRKSVNGTSSSNNFGASISLESLRTSIAFFKREQQRLKQQQQQGSGGGAGGSGNVSGGGPTASGRPTSATKANSNTTTSGVPHLRHQRLAYDDDADENFNDESDHYADEEHPRGVVAPPLRGSPGGSHSSHRPAWNADVEINYGDEPRISSPSSSGVAVVKKPRTGATVKTSAVRPPPGNKPTPSVGTSATARPSQQTRSGGVGGGVAVRRSSYDKENSLESAATAQSRGTAGAAAGGRRPPASRSSAVSGAPLNLDDIPVGGGSGVGGGMSSWADAYPPGMAPPDSRGGVFGEVTGGLKVPAAPENEVIASEAAAAAREPTEECPTCGRTFRVSVLPRHEALCRKQANKPRKVFNMRDQRLDGVEGIKEVQRSAPRNAGARGGAGAGAGGRGAGGVAGGKLPKWKVQHEQFQAAMRAVRQQNEGGGGFGSGALAPPPAPIPDEYDDRVPCPHCGRKFAEDVAARHIPKCATTVAKPKGIRPIRR